MARRAAAELTLDAAQYLAEAKVVEKTTAAVDAEMDQLDRSVDKVDRDMAELATSSAVAAKQVDNLGDQARGSAASLTALDARIKAMRLSVRNLGEEWARSGSKADQVAFHAEQRALAALERLRKTLVPDAGGSNIYRSVNALGPAGGGAGGGLGRLSATNPYVIAGILTAVTAAGPAIGAAVGGIVAGAIGTVGVAGGLAMAAKDPRVIGAAQDFGDVISAEFFRGGDRFVGPAIEGLHIIEQAFMDMKLPEAFAKMAPSVGIIAEGLGDLGRNIMPGLNAAFDRMGPFANAAADGFAELGDELGQFMDDVTASPGAVLGLRATFTLIGGTVVFLGKEIKFLSDAFAGLLVIAANAGNSGFIKFLTAGMSAEPAQAMQRWVDELFRARDGATEASYGVGVFGEAVDRATEETNILNAALGESYNAFLDFVGAEISAEQAIDDLADAFAKHGTTLDVDTQAGRDNLTILKDIAESALDATEKKLAETHSVDEANAVYDTYRQKLYDTAIQAGFTAEKAQELVDKWLALGQLQDIEKFVTITIEGRGSQGVAYLSGDVSPFLKGLAEGGTSPANEPFWVGERGPELMFSSRE